MFLRMLVRAAVLRVMEGEAQTAAQMSRLNWRLGEIYADCVEKAAEKFGVRVGLVGCHGQTVQHETRGKVRSTGRSTWQMGEAAMIAERMRCPVVSDFRPADVAAGGADVLVQVRANRVRAKQVATPFYKRVKK